MEQLKLKITQINKNMTMKQLDPASDDIQLLPELIIDTPVEYFVIIDRETSKVYYIYMTPDEINAY
jgi:hypothetical protein